MEEQFTTDDWRDFQRKLQEKKYNNWEKNVAIIERAAREYGIEVHWLTLYHARLSKTGCNTVDVFPTSGKSHFIGFYNKMQQHKNLGKFLEQHFNKPE